MRRPVRPGGRMRHNWIRAQVVFLDETSTHTSLCRRYARAPRGIRAYGRVPRNHGHNVTLLAALTPAGIGPSMTLTGAIDSAAFTAYVQPFLVPSLHPGQVVILDNLSAHKSAAARQAIEAVGCELRFLPAYSPDFNPIELAFAKIKSRLRAAAARDTAAWKRHCPGDRSHHPCRCPRLLRPLRLPVQAQLI